MSWLLEPFGYHYMLNAMWVSALESGAADSAFPHDLGNEAGIVGSLINGGDIGEAAEFDLAGGIDGADRHLGATAPAFERGIELEQGLLLPSLAED